MKTAFAIATILGLCATVNADCRRRVVQHVQQVEVVAAVPVVAAVYAPIPVYSVGYQSNDTQQLVAEVRALREQVQRLQAAPQAQPSQVHPGLTFLKNSCAKCHDAQVSKAKGAGFTYFNAGELMDLSDKQKLAVVAEIYHQRMPKGGKATDEDLGAVMNFFDAKTAAAVKPMPPAK